MKPRLRVVAILVAALWASWGAGAVDVPFLHAQIIENDYGGTRSAAVGDIDQDGDPDVAAAAFNPGTGRPALAWFENTAGDAADFDAHPIDASLDNALYVLLADLDNDGDLDVVAGTQAGIYWYRNDGSPQDRMNWPRGSNPVDEGVSFAQFLAAGDFDRDGDIDLAAVLRGNNAVRWYENLGPADEDMPGSIEWQAHPVDDAIGLPRTVFAEDIDGDGWMDLTVAASSSTGPIENQKVVWYENPGGTAHDAAWTERAVDTSFTGARWAYPADVDGDGDQDIVATAHETNTVAWFENLDGAGTSWTRRVVDSAFTGALAAAAADLDSDGDLDLIAGTDASVQGEADAIAWWEQVSGGWVKHALAFSEADPAFNRVPAVLPADLDMDGDVELIAAEFGAGRIIRLDNASIHRNATFEDAERVIDQPIFDVTDIATADVTGNGLLEIVVASPTQDQIIGWQWTGSTWQDVSIGFHTHVTEAAPADLDGDGAMDVVIAAASEGDISWFRNADGQGQSWDESPIVGNFAGARSLNTGDMDNDSDVDVVAAASANGDVYWFENLLSEGGGWFGHAIETDFPGVGAVALGDINGDGKLDVAAASASEGTIRWYENETAPGELSAFTAHTVTDGLPGAGPVHLADISGNGALDIVAGSNEGRLDVWRNAGRDGTNWTHLRLPQGSPGARHIAVADFDLDGDLDIVTGADAGAGPVTLFENPGASGAWRAWPQFTMSPEQALAHGDVDRDGDPDLIVSSSDRNVLRLSWFENRGGQLGFARANISKGYVREGARAPILSTRAVHQGRSSDAGIELQNLTLLFESADGSPLSTTQANNLIDRLEVFVDDGDGRFETSEDELVASLTTLDLDNGFQTVTLPAADSAQFAPGESPRLFVAVRANEGGFQRTPNRFQISHVPELGNEAVHLDRQAMISIGYRRNRTSASTVVAAPSETAIITLAGTNPVLHKAGTAYSDPGASAVDSDGDPIPQDEINVDNNVNPDVTGTYEVRYTAQDAPVAIRTVHVFDAERPVIALNGAAEVEIVQGAAYVDQGATAQDDLDGDLTSRIVVDNPVNPDRPGQYTVTYNVADSFGNQAEEQTRLVQVLGEGPFGDVNKDGTVNAVDIQLVINSALGIPVDVPDDAPDLNDDGNVNAVDIQLVINAALGLKSDT